MPPSSTLLFPGDYVDRGTESVEVMTLLLCLKLRYPERVTLLRSNEEWREMTRQYGFAAECKSEFGKQTHRLFCQVLNRLVMCAVVENPLFCVHSGIGHGVTTLDHIGRFELQDKFVCPGIRSSLSAENADSCELSEQLLRDS
jgi:hypothetical protein